MSEVAAEVAEVSPVRFDAADRAGIKQHLTEHGYACVQRALSPPELSHAHELLWAHLEGTEDATQNMTQRKPEGWRRDEPTTWLEGHGDALMTSTTHCESMWYVRSRAGVMGAFHAAYGTQRDTELVAMYDRMSVNLPTSSGNPETLRVAGESTSLGKFGVAQQMHTHAGNFYSDGFTGDEFYGIIPLFDMNRKTGATALVPGSHLKVGEIEEVRTRKWDTKHQRAEWTEADRLAFAADLEPFTAQGLSPVVTNIKAGDMVLFDTRTFHGGCSAEDPSGETGREEGNLFSNNLLRAIYILGASPSRLQTPEILAARRKAYELDLFWPPPLKHQPFAERILEGEDLSDQFGPPPDREATNGKYTSTPTTT